MLKEQLGRMLRFSNNYIADVLTLTMAADVGDKPAPQALSDASKTLSNFMVRTQSRKNRGSPPLLFSGSGLTPENELSANDLVRLLAYQYRDTRNFGPFYGGLVVPRQSPFIFLRSGSAAWQDRIALKTGTMDDPHSVCGMAGFLRKRDGGWISFRSDRQRRHDTEPARPAVQGDGGDPHGHRGAAQTLLTGSAAGSTGHGGVRPLRVPPVRVCTNECGSADRHRPLQRGPRKQALKICVDHRIAPVDDTEHSSGEQRKSHHDVGGAELVAEQIGLARRVHVRDSRIPPRPALRASAIKVACSVASPRYSVSQTTIPRGGNAVLSAKCNHCRYCGRKLAPIGGARRPLP